MQAMVTIQCNGCDRVLGRLQVDTADMPELLSKRVNDTILRHRAECLYYGGQPKAKFSFGRQVA